MITTTAASATTITTAMITTTAASATTITTAMITTTAYFHHKPEKIRIAQSAIWV
jgi:hypothetical protein